MQKNYKNDDTFLARWLSGDLSEEEHKSFEGSEDYADFRRISEASQELKLPSYNKLKALDRLKKARQGQAVPTKTETPTKNRRMRFIRWVAAAVALLLLGAIFLLNGTVKHGTLAGNQQLINLPDGSKVTLNANSSITYNKYRWNGKRVLELDGEAFFEVQKGSQFRVETEKGTVSVLGTSFNVYARKATLDVHCYTGKVRVASTTTQKTIDLVKGEEALFKSGIGEKKSFDAANPKSWRIGESVYQATPISRVIADVEHQFDVKIQTNGINTQQLYSGTFLHKDLKTALEMVFEPLGIMYEVEGEEVVLKK